MTYNHQIVTDISLLAGQILLESGAETYRVEDTMSRIARSFGIRNTENFVTPTVVMFSINGYNSQLVRINERAINLEKIERTNEISRALVGGHISPEEALEKLTELKDTKLSYSILMKVFAAALTSLCFFIMFRGDFEESLIAFLAGGIGWITFECVTLYTKAKFFNEFFASFAVALVAQCFAITIGSINMSLIIISALMPLVPGVPITNAIRDILAGQLLSGLSKGVEASITAFAIGAGVAIVLMFL